ncbi:alpha/beta hydrolase fold domain-containing protein, partial [Nonomuraea fuscirosea]
GPAEPGRGWVLLLHGGAYTTGSAYGFRSLAGALAGAVHGRVLTPDYRLAPEHPFPAALDDVHAAYTWLISQDAAPYDVVLAGDTSGAGLALSLLLRLKDRGQPLPAGSVLFTPYVDLSASCSDPARCRGRSRACTCRSPARATGSRSCCRSATAASTSG